MPSRTSARALQTRAEQGEAGPIEPRTERKAAPAPHRGAPGDVSPAAPGARPRRRRPRLIVEGAKAARVDLSSTESRPGAVLDYPIQTSKVQAPPLREETLARDRLLEWLSVKIHRRVVLLVAEAGYGKTTLLADFSRRTRVRMLWYRLDRGDRDWVGFMAYLVAAVRIHLPEFGATTIGLLRETATSLPSLESVIDAFLRELSGTPGEAFALVFDDVHLVDDAPEVRLILRELIERAPERMSFVFASRREPPIRIARLRALAEVAEIGTDDLRFDTVETARLFQETYDMHLEPTVLAELGQRTEGWAASLQLVRAALHDRDPAGVRAFISSLSGAEGHLYEYLAEEVIGELREDLQLFLMRTSVLDVVDLRLGPIAASVSQDEARLLIEDGERQGILGKGGPQTRGLARAHPLVRDFLQDRLVRAAGNEGVREIHLRVAAAAEQFDWHVSARHYLAGGSEASARRVVARSIEAILATGAYAAAQEVVAALGPMGLPGAAGLVLMSRLAQQGGAHAEGLRLAEEALDFEPALPAALLNLVAARSVAGDVEGALNASKSLANSTEPRVSSIGRATGLMLETSKEGSLEVAARDIGQLASAARENGEDRYLGVSLLNLTQLFNTIGDFDAALRTSEESIRLLKTSGGIELVSAHLAHSSALAFLGRAEESRRAQAAAAESAPSSRRLELASEIGQIEALLGDEDRGWSFMRPVTSLVNADSDDGEQALLARSLLWIRSHDLDQALADVSGFRFGTARSSASFEARRWLARGLVLALLDHKDALPAIRTGARLAAEQGSGLLSDYGFTMEALAKADRDPSDALISMAGSRSVVLSMLAEQVLSRLIDLRDDARVVVQREASLRPSRWISATRRLLGTGSQRDRRLAAGLLKGIGQPEDIPRLRDVGRTIRDREIGRCALDLARRLAPRVEIADLGRVAIVVGDRVVEGGGVRRKVLALMCLLVSKPKFGSTREEVIESLWPDQDPAAALNSLNQTVYFLRRVFEPDYADETSPGYVGQDGETVWLDSELITSTSRRCLLLIRSMPSDPTPEGSVELAKLYGGRFALDFAYEDWAAPYRDGLHAAYLRVMERAIRMDLDAGQFARGTFLAERALEVDPEAEEIQMALVRLYRLSGAHAAAAEQYQHYAVSMRELGVEPSTFSELVSG